MLCTQTTQDPCFSVKHACTLDCPLASHPQWLQFGCVRFVCLSVLFLCVCVSVSVGVSVCLCVRVQKQIAISRHPLAVSRHLLMGPQVQLDW